MCNEIIHNRLQAVVDYHKERAKIESLFIGLPDGSASLIKSLITLADPLTGIVSNISHHELAKLLTINPAPGRKESGTPTKQTIRNYIKSIERECGEYFKVISEGQKLQFLFPELPKVFNKIFENKELNTGVNSSNTQVNTEENGFLDDAVNTELNTEVNTPNPAVKKLFININNNNNNNLGEMIGNKNIKQPISPDFYPSLETLTRAIASGYGNAADAHVIQEFIDKNKAWGSEFADFNPVYLCFLAKDAERKQQKFVAPNNLTRRINHERTSFKNNSYDAAMEQVNFNNPDACAPSEHGLFPATQISCRALKHTTHTVALEGVDPNLWPIVSHQMRQ